VAKSPNKLLYLGFGLYWTWVYLSFNSPHIISQTPAGTMLIAQLHIVSGFAGVVVCIVVILRHRSIERSRHIGAGLWMAAMVTSAGTVFYALPLSNVSISLIFAGAVISGLTSPLIAMAWGVAYCDLNARDAAQLTAGSFLVSGVLYGLISMIPQPISGVLVTFMPGLSVTALYASNAAGFTFPVPKAGRLKESVGEELSQMIVHSGTGRVVVGLLLTMFVAGGLRSFIMLEQSEAYSQDVLVSGPIIVVALLFLLYASLVSKSTISLGPLYRLAMPLFALAFVLIALFGSSHGGASLTIVSAGSTLIEMLTWVLLIEIVRSTRFSALFVMAVGRFTIHLGMAVGETVAFLVFDNMTAFFVASIVILTVTAGFMFTDRDTTFMFDPPTADELPHMHRTTSANAGGPAVATGANPAAEQPNDAGAVGAGRVGAVVVPGAEGPKDTAGAASNAAGVVAGSVGAAGVAGTTRSGAAGTSAGAAGVVAVDAAGGAGDIAAGSVPVADNGSAGAAPTEAADEALSSASDVAVAKTLDERLAEIAQEYSLSPRETEVFTLWATGHGSKSIEEKLVVSAATVKTHLRHIYEKCGVHSRAEILDLIENHFINE
jgi:DNA-binding CsgD family transcriptional regulator